MIFVDMNPDTQNQDFQGKSIILDAVLTTKFSKSSLKFQQAQNAPLRASFLDMIECPAMNEFVAVRIESNRASDIRQAYSGVRSPRGANA